MKAQVCRSPQVFEQVNCFSALSLEQTHNARLSSLCCLWRTDGVGLTCRETSALLPRKLHPSVTAQLFVQLRPPAVCCLNRAGRHKNELFTVHGGASEAACKRDAKVCRGTRPNDLQRSARLRDAAAEIRSLV